MMLKLTINLIAIMARAYVFKWGMWLQLLLVLTILLIHATRPFLSELDNLLQMTVLVVLVAILSVVNSYDPSDAWNARDVFMIVE